MILFLLASAIAWLLFHNFYWKRRHYPPGPTPFPILGNSPQLFNGGRSNEDLFIRWRKQFGDVFTIWLGGTPAVTVNGYQAIMDHFVRDADSYSGRFASDDFYEITRGGKVAGIIGTEGDYWRENKRFALHVFKNFGLGKNLMQEMILTDVADLIRMINAGIDGGVKEQNIRGMIEIRVGSIINVLLLGYRFDESRVDEFRIVKERIARHTTFVGNPLFRLSQSNPALFRRLPVAGKFLGEVKENFQALIEFFNKQVEDHLKELDLDSDATPTDFVHAYLQNQHQMQGNHKFGRFDMLNVIFDLWLAGQETTSTTLCWLLIYMIAHPECQEKMYEEIRAKIGNDRLVVMSDRNDLPYTCAVVNETLRVANLLPLNLPHKTLKDVEVNGYKIPRNTIIIPQISTVLYDECVFPNPHEFIPERFLDKNGQLKTCNELIPFSIGKRQCLGEGLARMEMFLFTANLFNQFKITSGRVKPDATRKLGGTANCNPFTCVAERRYKE